MTHFVTTNAWNYRRTDDAGIIELASWRGAGSPGLRPHFHDETQIVLVLSGSRAFHVGGATVTVPAGHAAVIPAGVLHTPMPAPDQADETICLNAYVPAICSSASVRIVPLQQRWRRVDEISPEAILKIADDLMSGEAPSSPAMTDGMKLGTTLTSSFARIGDIATRFGRSREGFSRLVTRELGVAPHAFRILARLNVARQLLREGCPVAAVAAEAGFSDQSHLTRLFRRTFGTTPGVYWRD